jgi:hypothetical protein
MRETLMLLKYIHRRADGVVCGEHVRPDLLGRFDEAETDTLQGLSVDIGFS